MGTGLTAIKDDEIFAEGKNDAVKNNPTATSFSLNAAINLSSSQKND